MPFTAEAPAPKSVAGSTVVPEILAPLMVPEIFVVGKPSGFELLDESVAVSVVPKIVPEPVNELLPDVPVIETMLPL